MENRDRRMNRSRTKAVRVYMEDWLVVDKVSGRDRPMKEGFKDIIEVYKEYRDVKEIGSLDELGSSV